MSNPRGRSDAEHIAPAHDYCLLYAKSIKHLETNQFMQTKDKIAEKYNKEDVIGKYRELPLRRSGSNSHREDRPNLYYPLFFNLTNEELSIERKNKDDIEILPVDTSGTERVWRWGKDYVQKNAKSELMVKRNGNGFAVYTKDRLKREIMPKSVWVDSLYDTSSHGTVLLKNILGDNKFSYPKSINTVKNFLTFGLHNHSTVLDYFAGSGTTAHAVINLNREDGGRRKYLLIEMGEYFHTVLLPRIKKIIYSKDWKDGRPVSHEGSSHFLKYYTLEQYEETLRKSHYEDGEQLELDSTKSPFEQYVFFADDKLGGAVKA